MKIGDVAIIPFTLAITEGLKSIFGTKGKTNQIVAMCVATVLTFLAITIDQGLVGPQAATWIRVAVTSVGGGLSAIGLFDYVRKEIVRA
jgi:hypothetical protein